MRAPVWLCFAVVAAKQDWLHEARATNEDDFVVFVARENV